MGPLDAAKELFRSGRFADAARALDRLPGPAASSRTANLLRAQILERLGRHGECLALIGTIAPIRSLTDSERATCEYVLALVCVEQGQADRAIQHLQKSIGLARSDKDFERLAWAQIRLSHVVGERSGAEAASTLIKEARLTTIQLADPQLSAALHIFVGDLEAQRGLIASAERHVELGLALLKTVPNLWLETIAENIRFSSGFFRQEFDRIVPIGQRALRLAEESGAESMRRACLGNLGNLFSVTGEFEKAGQHLERALAAMPSSGDRTCATLDSLAEVRSQQGRLDEASQLFERIDELVRLDASQMHYATRFTQLTRSYLFEHQERLSEALQSVERAIELATAANDTYLLRVATLRKSALLIRLDRTPEALDDLRGLAGQWWDDSPNLYAEYESSIAAALARTGSLSAAEWHRDRAHRIYSGVKNAQGLQQLERSFAQWQSPAGHASAPSNDGEEPSLSGRMLQAVALIFSLSARPRLLAEQVRHVLEATNCVRRATVVVDDTAQGLNAAEPGVNIGVNGEQRWWIGHEADQSVAIHVWPKPDAESQATVNAAILLLSRILRLRHAQSEYEARAGLWPTDDLPPADEKAVLGGHLRALMGDMKHVATTNISVLITGESGTGKEVLARAIHARSMHPEKPFVPFNCAAVPRDLLESQLFGHRKGAFTGADRDHPGVIRQARGGTLFLDEIGELGMHLQPKLLRFLESGEICPVGESVPFTVKVRVIAATNANLEKMVAEQRFREDLFYRLNVVRLSINPLRERRDEIPALVNHFVSGAVEEFGRGRIRIAEDAVEQLLLYSWPGNVRQLQNEIRRMVAIVGPDSVLTRAALSPEIREAAPLKSVSSAAPAGPAGGFTIDPAAQLNPTLSRIERAMIEKALREHGGKLDPAARALGISRKGLYLKRQRLGLD